MELKQLRFFIAVADCLNFTRAAERMGIAQPPLSQRIRSLEEELGVVLFIRNKRKVELTQAGETLLLHARRLVNASNHATEIVRAVRDGQQGVLSIGAIFSTVHIFMPRTLKYLTKAAPNVDVHLREMTIPDQIRALHEGQIDIGVLRPPVGDKNIFTETLYEETFVAAIPSEHRLAKSETVSLEDFLASPFIGVSPSFSRNYSIVAASAFASARDKIDVVHETYDIHTMIALVAAGRGLALLPESLTFMRIPEVVYRPLRFRSPTISVSLAWHKDSTSPILEHFFAAARLAAANPGTTQVSSPSL